MGCVVFNYKCCDHAKGCPAIQRCEQEIGCTPGKAAIYYDENTKKIVVDELRCTSHMCKSRVCTIECPKCFTYAENQIEKWWAIEKVRETINTERCDRYNSEFTISNSRLSFNESLTFINGYNGLAILEITGVASCIGESDCIPIQDIIPFLVYQNCYKKVVLRDENEVTQIEEKYGINELPALLFFFNGEVKGKILGIYRYCEIESIKFLKVKVKSIISPYL